MNQQLLAINNALPIGNLEAYVYRVNQIPMLSAEEEQALAEELQKNDDLNAAKQLVLAHLRYVVRVARGYSGYGLALGDLIQEGNIGLMKAVKRFDPKVGVRLVSFAVHWIKAEIHEFVLKNWRIVKVATTKAQRKLFFNLRNMKKRLGWFSNEELNAVARDLGVSREEVQLMEQRLNAMDSPYDGPEPDDENAYIHTPAHYIDDSSLDPARLFEEDSDEARSQHYLIEALGELDDRSKDILQSRWLNDQKTTLHDLAAKYNVSAERIRQLEKNAMQKMRHQLEQPTV